MPNATKPIVPSKNFFIEFLQLFFASFDPWSVSARHKRHIHQIRGANLQRFNHQLRHPSATLTGKRMCLIRLEFSQARRLCVGPPGKIKPMSA
jgi:hypothetical protein